MVSIGRRQIIRGGESRQVLPGGLVNRRSCAQYSWDLTARPADPPPIRLLGVLGTACAVALASCGGAIRPTFTPGEDAAVGDDFGLPALTSEVGRPMCQHVEEPLAFQPRMADVLIAFDRSGSMSAAFGDGTRYSVEASLLKDLLPVYDDKIRFGYQAFPARAVCGPNYIERCCAARPSVPVALRNAARISEAIEDAAPVDGNTPTAEALRFAREYFAELGDGIPDRYVLLSTDGRPSCTAEGGLPDGPGQACDDALEAITRLVEQNIRVIVLGVGPGLEVDPSGAPSCLQQMARRGGVMREGGGPAFFSATDRDSLETALQTIFGGVIRPSCRIELKKEPADRGQVRVYMNGREVPRHAAEGWDYAASEDPRIISLRGSYCRRLETFQVTLLEIRFGCPPCMEARLCE